MGKLEEGKGKQARIRGREGRWGEREEEANRERKRIRGRRKGGGEREEEKSIQEGEGETKGSREKRKDWQRIWDIL